MAADPELAPVTLAYSPGQMIFHHACALAVALLVGGLAWLAGLPPWLAGLGGAGVLALLGGTVLYIHRQRVTLDDEEITFRDLSVPWEDVLEAVEHQGLVRADQPSEGPPTDDILRGGTIQVRFERDGAERTRQVMSTGSAGYLRARELVRAHLGDRAHLFDLDG